MSRKPSAKSIIFVALVMLVVAAAAFILNQKEAIIEAVKEAQRMKKEQEEGR